jgi:hypothetical protein
MAPAWKFFEENIMADATPTMEISGAQTTAERSDVPTQQPPNLGSAARSAMQGETTRQRYAGGAAEMLSTPTLPISGGVAASVGAWQNTKKVDSLWTINQDRNSWVGISGIGWKKLSGPDETSISALTMLFAHARATGSTVNYRDESDALIHEVYVW